VSHTGTDEIEARIAHLEQRDERLTQALEMLARHTTAPATKAGKHWDGYAAVIASFIGLLALAVSGYTAILQRTQLRAQTWPHLRIVYSNVKSTFTLVNHGTGPAQITAMRVTMAGAPMQTWSAIARAAGFTGDEGIISSSARRAVLSPDTTLVIASPTDHEAARVKFKELLPRGTHAVSLTVCYCSVLHECWVTGDDVPQEFPDDRCPIREGEGFED